MANWQRAPCPSSSNLIASHANRWYLVHYQQVHLLPPSSALMNSRTRQFSNRSPLHCHKPPRSPPFILTLGLTRTILRERGSESSVCTFVEAIRCCVGGEWAGPKGWLFPGFGGWSWVETTDSACTSMHRIIVSSIAIWLWKTRLLDFLSFPVVISSLSPQPLLFQQHGYPIPTHAKRFIQPPHSQYDPHNEIRVLYTTRYENHTTQRDKKKNIIR